MRVGFVRRATFFAVVAFAVECLPGIAHAEAPPPPSAADRMDVTLYMPEDIFLDLHLHARRLDLSDSMLLSACWYASRAKIDSKEGAPKLTASRSGAVYFSLPREVHDEVARVAAKRDRSKSWVLMKAWNLAREQVMSIRDQQAFMTWLRSNKSPPASKRTAPRP